MQHSDVELAVAYDGHDGAASGRIYDQVAGTALGYRLAEPSTAGRQRRLTGQAERRRHDGGDPRRLHVRNIVSDQ
jgi:hypothetical protein